MTSHLVSNMQYEADRMGTFPVLIGDEVAYFHEIDGEFDSKTGNHIINFIHAVQEDGSPYRVDSDQASHNIEAHLDDNYYNLDVVATSVEDEYPDEPYVFSVQVSDYRFGPYSFSDALTEDIDKREERYE